MHESLNTNAVLRSELSISIEFASSILIAFTLLRFQKKETKVVDLREFIRIGMDSFEKFNFIQVQIIKSLIDAVKDTSIDGMEEEGNFEGKSI